jgi:putative Holliday junction resolvase
VSDPLHVIAKGLEVIINSPKALLRIKELADEFDVGVIVVGMPYNLKGEEGAKATEVKHFMDELITITGRTVVSVDERFSSKIAQETFHIMGVKKKQRQTKGNVDLTAAAIILQSYLDAQSGTANSPN